MSDWAGTGAVEPAPNPQVGGASTDPPAVRPPVPAYVSVGRVSRSVRIAAAPVESRRRPADAPGAAPLTTDCRSARRREDRDDRRPATPAREGATGDGTTEP